MVVRSRFARALPAVAVLLATLALFPVKESVAASRYTVLKSNSVMEGLSYREIKDSQGPRRIFVLTVDPSKVVTVDVALALDHLGHVERTSSMAARHGAVAGINGDFGAFSGRPSYGYAEDGDLKILPVLGGPRNVAVKKDETQSFVGTAAFSVTHVEVDSSERWAVKKWNYSKPASGEIAGYTKAGGDFAKPPSSHCYARLRPTSKLAWVGTGGLGREYSVARAVCQTSPLLLGDTEGVVVLAAKPGTSQGNQLKTLSADEKVRLLWSYRWPGVMDLMGGVPSLMQGGSVVAKACSADLCNRHPRTGVGRRSDGKLLFVVVDGRRTGWSIGYTLVEFAQLFKWLGAVDAVNLDGGGSSTMVVNGAIKNRPSDGSERAIVNSLLVLPGADAAEPTPTTGFQPAATSVSESSTVESMSTGEREALLAAALDPGSSGGMVDALMRGAVGPRPQTLPPDLAEVLRRYREQKSGI
jgi:hypothetical protein